MNQQNKMNQQYDVAVVGYGACSSVLVNLLVGKGLRVIVLDKEPGVLEIPRAAHFDDEILRTFQIFGAADDLSASFTTSADYGLYNIHGDRVWGFREVDPQPTDQGWLSDYFFFQPAFEHYLRKKALEAGCAVGLSCEVVDLEDEGGFVTVTYKDVSITGDNNLQKISAKYVVGADGASSFVRKHIGTKMEQLSPSQRWMIVDVHVKEGVEVDLSNDCWTKVGETSTITYVPMPEDMKRFEFSLTANQTEEEVKRPEAVEEFLAEWFEKPDDYELLRADVYSFHSLVANDWAKGRIIIAGDAAHLNPPFLGQGVCAGIRDALNLGWKLARVIKGESPASLLDTYQSERRPHAYVLVEIAGEVGEKIDWMAHATKEELAAMEKGEHEHPRPPLGAGLHSEEAISGGLLGPQPRLSDGTLLDFTVGYNFAVVGDPEVIGAISSDTAELLKVLGAVTVADSSDTVRSALQAFGGSVMVLRPDRYIAGMASSASEVDVIIANLVAGVVG